MQPTQTTATHLVQLGLGAMPIKCPSLYCLVQRAAGTVLHHQARQQQRRRLVRPAAAGAAGPAAAPLAAGAAQLGAQPRFPIMVLVQAAVVLLKQVTAILPPVPAAAPVQGNAREREASRYPACVGVELLAKNPACLASASVGCACLAA